MESCADEVPAAISTRSESRARPLALQLLLHFVAADAGAMIDDRCQSKGGIYS